MVELGVVAGHGAVVVEQRIARSRLEPEGVQRFLRASELHERCRGIGGGIRRAELLGHPELDERLVEAALAEGAGAGDQVPIHLARSGRQRQAEEGDDCDRVQWPT